MRGHMKNTPGTVGFFGLFGLCEFLVTLFAFPALAVDCRFNEQTVADGASVTAYLAKSVPAGRTCKQESRKCQGGVLSGGYMFAECMVRPEPVSATIQPTLAHVGEKVMIIPAGGIGPYSMQVVSGSGALQGTTYTAPGKEEIAVVTVKDSRGESYELRLDVLPTGHTHLRKFQYQGVDSTTIKAGSNSISYDFVVPAYKTMKVKLWGPGGSSYQCNPPPAGHASTFGGLSAGAGSVKKGGAATGGDLNIDGKMGSAEQGAAADFGGKGAVKGAKAARPGGGGLNAGAGAYVEKLYKRGELKEGEVVKVIVGAENGGACWNEVPNDLGTYGADGEVDVSW